jgi:hypothetical protein
MQPTAARTVFSVYCVFTGCRLVTRPKPYIPQLPCSRAHVLASWHLSDKKIRRWHATAYNNWGPFTFHVSTSGDWLNLRLSRTPCLRVRNLLGSRSTLHIYLLHGTTVNTDSHNSSIVACITVAALTLRFLFQCCVTVYCAATKRYLFWLNCSVFRRTCHGILTTYTSYRHWCWSQGRCPKRVLTQLRRSWLPVKILVYIIIHCEYLTWIV